MSRQARDIEDQNQHERMAEVRSYKRRPEDISNKIRRCSRDKQLVKHTNQAIENINNAIDTLMTNIDSINNESAWALEYNTTDELFDQRIKCPPHISNHLRKLQNFKNSKLGGRDIADIRVIDLFRLLNDSDLMDTTLRIIDKKDRQPTLKIVIKTIKKIHVKGHGNYTIPPKVLDSFCKNSYVKPTRVVTGLILTSDSIHDKFEQTLPSYSESQNKLSNRGFGPIDPYHKDMRDKKKRSIKK
ncbi:hypothetical protein [Paraglaciecola sp. MB-3u-78]|uniref:hypothetical protein n=1 Tax=Paraglaciecola sp. MB-3u-78 TaxID=2058332 RepID=UPI000C3363D0|nr:hypothetical protein [Paraglaciecola sp. MB-3u-78]PKG93159.1 hypothetical protein CXF95_26590 [Paraglaciecola sp. MB-3u-78]